MHNLPRLVIHLHLLLRIAIGLEHVYLRYHIVGQLVGKFLHGLHLAFLHHLLILLLQLGHGSGTGSGGTLIGSHVDTLDVAQLLQGLEHHHHHNRRAVGIGNDATRALQRVLRITFWHHQGHIVVHTECTRIVDHHGTMLRNRLSKLLRRASTGRGEGDVNILEVIVVLQELHFNLFTFEGVLLSGTALRAKQHQFVHREVPLGENAQELLSYGA